MLSFSTRFLSVLLTVAVLVGLSPGTTVQAQDLNLSYNANKSPVQPGASVTYTVHVSNTGSADVTGATVTIPIPAVIEGFSEDARQECKLS
jgi:uncharacterized repeat protein (TIGR01451 family)